MHVLALLGVGLVAAVVAGAIAGGGALATVIVLFALGAILVVVPLVVIHFDEHEDRLRRPGPHASH